jgi:hypothetical protein
MRLPLVIFESGDLQVYASARAVERELEAIDVRRGAYVGWDADGRPLDLTADADGGVRVDLSEQIPQREQLMRTLRETLERVGHPAPAGASQAALLSAAASSLGMNR